MTDTHTASPSPEDEAADWTDQAVDVVEQVVGTIRDRAVEPAQRATSAVVFGVLTAFFVIPAVVLLTIAAFRLVDNYLPGGTWATWLGFGGIFLVGGAFTWARRHPVAD